MSVLNVIGLAVLQDDLTFWTVVVAVLCIGYAVHVVRGLVKGASTVLPAQGKEPAPTTPAPNGEGALSYATLEELTR